LLFQQPINPYLESMKSIAVYCGSSTGINGVYKEEAELLGRLLTRNNIKVIYGGGKVGMMGVLANAVLDAGGHITGVIPGFLQTKEVAHDGLSEMVCVDTMHERKALINEMSDGAITLAGGFGTMDELFEMLTWGQLGLHQKPVGLVNTNGYFSHILNAIQKMVEEGFLKEINKEMALVGENAEDLLLQMENYQAPSVPKWITKEV